MASTLRERLAVAVLLGSIPLGALAAGAIAYSFHDRAIWVLLVQLVVGGIGIRLGDWPPVEYALVLIITTVLAGLLLPATEFVVCLPGACAGYLWGGYVARIIDKPNIDRLVDPQHDESASG